MSDYQADSRNTKGIVIMLFVLLMSISGCNKTEPTARDSANNSTASDMPVVYTVNYPLYYFASRIAGDFADVVFPAPPDIDPAFWQPDEVTIRSYQKADKIFLNGAEYAKWTQIASLPNSRLVNTSAAFSDKYLKMEDITVHSHGPDGKHEHGAIDFNTWLDPVLAQQQAQAVHQVLLRLLPKHQVDLQKNFAALENDLTGLDDDLENLFSQKQKTPLIASHPVYNYFVKRYQLNLKNLHWEPDQMPDESEWIHLKELLKTHPATFMIWEAPPCESIRKQLKQLNLEYSVFYPCSNKPKQGDYLTVMKENIAQLKLKLQQTCE